MKRCVYCGHRCHGRACRYHKDLTALDPHAQATTAPTMRNELATWTAGVQVGGEKQLAREARRRADLQATKGKAT